jgi:phosphoenolpyruvate carboxykinase (diphosphate)
MPISTIQPSVVQRNEEIERYINLKLAALGQPTSRDGFGSHFLDLARPLLRNYQQKNRLLGNLLCPPDARIQAFLDAYLADVCPADVRGESVARLPANALVLDREGMARVMSLPADSDFFCSPYLRSYRVAQGVLHNPTSDRRTTQGLFHICEGGFPIPADKAALPKRAFAALWNAALHPPAGLLQLPFTAGQEREARCFVSLLIRPLVNPAAGSDPEKTMEIRFFAPASLVSNLDFVESIFGNAGDPYLPENDAA